MHKIVTVFMVVAFFTAQAQNIIDNNKNEVLIYDSLSCFNGINSISGFRFIDMHGNIVKQRNAQLGLDIDKHRYVGISGHEKFSMFYNDSIVWTLNGSPHHVLFLDDDTNIAALGFEKRVNKSNRQLNYEVLFTASLDGQIIKTQSFYVLADQIQKFLPKNRDSIIKRNKEFVSKYIPNRLVYFDSFFFHINSVQIIPSNNSEKIDSTFKHGNLLISDFTNNFIAIIDRNDFHILWFYFQAESFLGQHTPQMLADGRIIYLVNNIKDKADNYYSAVRILNPVTRKIEWEYSGSPAHTLHSFTQGSCQLLDNKNVLITVNNEAVRGNGYVIEVTPSGKIVWKWVPVNFKEFVDLDEGFTYVHRLLHL